MSKVRSTDSDSGKQFVARAEGEAAVYGVNTGFGKLASVKIAAKDTARLQRNLILSHCCGVGDALDNGKLLDEAVRDLTKITGQAGKVTFVTTQKIEFRLISQLRRKLPAFAS